MLKNSAELWEIYSHHSAVQGCTNRRCHIARATKFCLVVHNISASSVWSSLHVTLLVSEILRWLLKFWKICRPLVYYSMYIVGSMFLKNEANKRYNIN